MNNCVGIILTLEGRSKKGRERVKQYGDKWKIVEIIDKKGTDERPLLRVKSLPITLHSDDRWIKCDWDQDFEIVAF